MNRSNRCGRKSGVDALAEIPHLQPQASRRRAAGDTTIAPPSGENLMALVIRFQKICWKRAGSSHAVLARLSTSRVDAAGFLVDCCRRGASMELRDQLRRIGPLALAAAACRS